MRGIDSLPMSPSFRLAPTLLAGLLLSVPASASAETLKAEAILPPGQSGFVSITGVATGTGSPHLTDQAARFEAFDYRPFGFDQPASETFSPRAGVSVARDAFGVPSITASNEDDAWFGVGYAIAQDRLFQLELFRRATSGRLGEILGRDYLDDDIIARRDYYTDTEVDAMLAALPQELRDRVNSYRDGINAYVQSLVRNPSEVPGEFVALGVAPPTWTARDTARVGIFLARTVPSGDGEELANALALKASSPRSFQALHPVRTPGRRTTVPRSEGAFPAQPGRSRRDERIGFKRTRRFLARTDLASAEDTAETLAAAAGSEVRPGEAGADLRRVLPSPGGSFMWAIADRKRSRSFQFNGPQLGFSIPELFVEFELHSPEFPNLRGVTAAGVPLVGIGHNNRVAWGFTSGLSDEDDLYVEKLTGEETYRFRGSERQMDCRDETIDYREAPTGLPGLVDNPGQPAGSRTERICRTLHGPIQYRGDGVALARRYAIWGRELETFVGLDLLNRARTVRDVDAAMQKVTWNENVIAADSRGGIGYWHPGLHQLKPKRWDERLPFPGSGGAEWRGILPRRKTPHAINPAQGWLTNWNNPPSVGWTNGDGTARERLSGPLHRVRILQGLVGRAARNPTYAKHIRIVRRSGTTAQQFPFAKRRLRAAKRASNGASRKLLRELLRWNGNYDREDDAGTVAPGVAIWEELKSRSFDALLRRLGEGARPLGGGTGSSHAFDITNGEAKALLKLRPRTIARAAGRAAAALTERFDSSDPGSWREPRRLYEIGAQGAASAPELEFFDRGTWEQSLMMGRR